jgi:hypothetical protein
MRLYANATLAAAGLLLLAANVGLAAGDANPPKAVSYQDYYSGSLADRSPFVAEQDCNAGAECGSGCCTRCCGGLVAGVEATFLKPNVRDLGVTVRNNIDPLNSKDLADFGNLSAAPRVWLGVENARGWGVRARYWQFDATSTDDEQRAFVGNSIVDTLAAESSLRAYTLDLEGTKRIAVGNWCVLGTFGVRNAEFKATHAFDMFSANVNGTHATTIGAITTENVRELHGTGLTGSVEAVYPFGCHGLSVFWNLRGSTLWGSTRAAATNRFMDSTTALQLISAGEDSTAYIIETQAGVRWEHRVECFNACAFAQMAFEYQKWTADRSATTFDYNQTVNGMQISGHSLSTTVDFTGLAVAIGFTR